MAEQDEIAESMVGRLWLGCAAMVTVAAPLWFMLTAIIIQLSPELSGFDVVMDGAGEVRRVPVVSAWFWGGLLAAALMVAVAPLMGTMLGLFRAGASVSRRREEAERLRYDALVRDAAVLRDVSWQEAVDDASSDPAITEDADDSTAPDEPPPTTATGPTTH